MRSMNTQKRYTNCRQKHHVLPDAIHAAFIRDSSCLHRFVWTAAIAVVLVLVVVVVDFGVFSISAMNHTIPCIFIYD